MNRQMSGTKDTHNSKTMNSKLETRNYEVTIGLETHVQLKTSSKLFCGCSTQFGSSPNSQTCPICLGFPGVLPVLNRRVVELALRVGVALNAKINSRMKFDRKNYFYPDLPKNFQISQYDLPIAINGKLEVSLDGGLFEVGIRRVHIEEDAGKLVHKADGSASLVDFNRSGMPLIEIVTEPDLHSPEEAFSYLEQLKSILQYLQVSECDMEKGSLRCDANISLKVKGVDDLGTKAEVKNINSFRGVRAALTYEIKRQSEELDLGNRIVQETRLWDQEADVTRHMRSKEGAHDYRYFPEPDLVPFLITEEMIDEVRRNLPELARERQRRFIKQYALPEYDALILTKTKAVADYFESCARLYPKTKMIANWVMGDLMAQANEQGVEIPQLDCPPEWLVEMLELVDRQTLSGKMAKELLIEMIQKKQSPQTIVAEKGLAQISDESSLLGIICDVIQKNEKSVQDYCSGKTTALMFLVGQVMRETHGKANPQRVQEFLRKELEKGEA